MEQRSNTLIVGILMLIIGLLLGYLLVPRILMPYGFGMGGMIGDGPGTGMQANVDRHFIEQMIPHHEGAIAMAELALERSERPEILSLANGIIEAQTRENEDIHAWYQEWFGSAPRESGGMGMMHVEGMEGDLEALQNAEDFDLEFIEQMIPHHEMAIMMADMLQAGTERPEMRELADGIITSQSREINMMESWHEAWQGG